MSRRSPAEAERAYLLGRATEAEREAVEEALFTEPQAHERLNALEGDLAEAYASGALESGERSAFETRLAADERLQERVRITRELTRTAQWSEAAPRRRNAVRTWAPRLAFVAALGSGAVIVTQSSRPTDDDAFRAKGTASVVFDVVCRPACRIGGRLRFELRAPPGRPFFAAFGRRADGRMIWYEPQASSVSRPAETDLWPRAYALSAPHSLGPHTVFAVFSERPLSRAEIIAAMGDDLSGSSTVSVLRRQLRIEAKP